MRATEIHEHRWVAVAFVANVPTGNGDRLGYHIRACRECGWAAPDPMENYLLSTDDHKTMVEHELADIGLRMCFTGEES